MNAVTRMERVVSQKRRLHEQLDHLAMKIWIYLTKTERLNVAQFKKEPHCYYHRSARYYRTILKNKPNMAKTCKRLLRRYIAGVKELGKWQYVYVQQLFWLPCER